MTPQLPAAVASAIVTSLEDLELPLLSWGVTSGTLSHDEVLWAIDQQLLAGDSAVDPPRVLQALLRQALLFQVPATSPPRYRTRLAETLRLTAQLRQLFPPRDLDNPPKQWWEQGRPLVADYRLLVTARLYPRRDVAVSEVMSELGRLPGWGSLQDDVTRAQIADRALARFQVDAATSIFRSLASGRGRSLVIGAGTGTGKTLAFYLPAFASMAQDALPNDARLHTLALYPRKELLRDQLREAVTVALAVNDALLKAGRRTLRIGALYGDTPHHPDDHRLSGDGGLAKVWRRDGQDLTCPYLTCPRCEADLVWPEPERRSGREMLMCRSCGLRLDDHVVLTRDALRRRPPDLLFTTTEMLNRCASDRRLGRLLGWQGGPAPSLVLLDEVHTYAGVHGAQVALLLRRWRNDVRTPATFVGLSATLRDAGAFFSELTGVEESLVDHIEPQADDLEPGGREYTLALRGDPLSGVSLLSTSIQAAMLYGRVLDVPGHEYLHGSKGFIFTDDLDVTNRFYDDLRDAEGALPRGQRARLRTGQVLAGLRSPDAPFASERFTAGQSWELVQRIGHPLSPRADANGLVIGRTSSQDSGVDRDANLIVATASLEVGYNDPHVGLVLQHKAPHDPAAFIQRRGRAGRRRSIRPWTVVILSDYGRDRLAYQAYDTLFTPEVPPRQLPVGNRFVLKIHATHALLDWLGRKLTSRGCEEDPRRLLRAPKQAVTDLGPAAPLIDLLEALLNDSILQDELAAHLQAALQISADEATALLWEQPRAVLMGVVPTALRRLRTGWRPVAQDPGASPGDLLPEYLTSTLFDPLNVPQVWLALPFAGTDDEPLPIEKALLREAVPGRVSRRYGYRSETHRTWVPLPPPNAGGALEVAAVAPVHTRQGTWPFGTGTVEVVRPHVLRLDRPPREITNRAHGVPIWASQLLPPTAGMVEAHLPQPSPWVRHIASAGFATHAAGNPAKVRRMTVGAHCETTYENAPTQSTTVRYTIEGRPAALGFELSVDAMRFTLAPLDVADEAVARHLASPAWRSIAFTASVRDDPDLDAVANAFQRDWLILVYLTAVALAGADTGHTAQQVHAALANGAWAGDLPTILQVLYRDPGPVGQAPAPARLIATLTTLSQDSRVRACLDRHGQLLWTSDIADRTVSLAQRAYRDTMAAALAAAAQRACPDAQDDDLIVDVVPEDQDHDCTVWISETAIGGLGVVEHLAGFYAEDPRRFWGLVESALAPSDLEYIDAALTRLLEHVAADAQSPAAQAMQDLRQAGSAADADAALSRLRSAWAALDGHPRHAAVAALSNRLLRPGSDRATDLTALAVVQAWAELEHRLGFEVDARAIAYAVDSGRFRLPGVGNNLVADQVFSMLWPRGNQARTQHLMHYQPYAARPVLDRLLAVAVHEDRLPQVYVNADGWQDEYVEAVVRHGAVELVAQSDQSPALADAVRAVVALPVDRDVLRVYAEIVRVHRAGGELRARAEIREAVQ